MILPVGALEQHGLHLPLDTDTEIARLLAERVATSLDGLVLPAIAYGARSFARSEVSDFQGQSISPAPPSLDLSRTSSRSRRDTA